MKKLMFAMAAVAAGTVVADITSNNIVGYAQNEELSPWGSVFNTAQFNTVGADQKIKLGDITPIGDDTADTVTIQILNDDGTTDFEKSWTWNGTTWMNDSKMTDDKDYQVAAGTAFCTSSSSDEPAKLQSAGEVSQTDLQFDLSPWGSVGVGNPFPVKCTLGDIVPMGDDTADTVTIQILNDDGTTDYEKSWTWNGSKWMNDSTMQDDSAYEINPGVGMCVSSSSDESAQLFIPAPEL